uniref:Duf155-domain-containing protein n=1 Tax=Tetraselmis sp. GSL018 TaxID=582737 RepID=A0A061R447_9CHLO
MDQAGAYHRLSGGSPPRTQRSSSATGGEVSPGGENRGQPAAHQQRRMSHKRPNSGGIISPNPALRQNQPAVSRGARESKAKPKLKPKHLIAGPQGRSTVGKERFVPLTVDDDGSADVSRLGQPSDGERSARTPTLFEDLETLRARGRVTIYCLAESTDLKILERKLTTCEHANEGDLKKFPEVIYCQFRRIAGGDAEGDLFFFDYGVVACWGLDEEEEAVVARFCKDCLIDPLDTEMVEVDELTYQYTSSEKPHIQNDIVTLNRRLANIHEVKMAICHAFAQSTKLALFEEQVTSLVEDTRELPEKLAEEGEVHMKRKDINKLIGQVFLQKAAVNLLSTVLDTPEFFWSAPDSLQALYKRVCDYLEMDDRVDLLNRRFSVLQEMLDMLRDQTNNAHAQRLEWIVIWLIVVEVVIGLFECLSILGWVGPKHSR